MLLTKSFMKYKLNQMILACIFLCFMGLSHVVSFFIFSGHYTVLHHSAMFIIFAVPASYWGFRIAAEKKWNDMFYMIERLSIIIIPLAISYISIRIISISPFDPLSIGVINYLMIGGVGGLVPFLLALCINYVKNETVFANLSFLSNKKYSYILRPVIIAILWLAIILSSARVGFAMVVAFSILLLIYSFCKRVYRRQVVILFSLLAVFFAGAELTNLGDSHLTRRFSLVIQGVFQRDLITAVENPIVRESIDYLIAMDIFATTQDPDVQLEEYETTSDLVPAMQLEEFEAITRLIRDRGTLFRLAWREAINNPLTGLHPLGFSIKYGIQPHNILLEALADLGIVFGGILILFILTKAFKLFLIMIKGNAELALIIIFLGSLFLSQLQGGVLWHSHILYFCVCFSIGLIYKENISSAKE